MEAIADGLRVTPDSYRETGQPNVMTPVYGSLKDISVKVENHREYNESKSKETGKEEYKEERIVLFRCDKFSNVPVPVKELDTKRVRDLSSLLTAFEEQTDTEQTKVINWPAISAQEKQFVMEMQLYTVEQVSHFPEIEAFRLGPSGKDIINKAKRHVETKVAEKKEKEDSLESVKVLRAELEAVKAQLAAKPVTESVIELEAKKAISKKKKEAELLQAA